jgi:acetyl-CoA C-acetyltransferase
VSDGAAALVVASVERARELGLVPMAVIRAEATAGREPEWFGLAPIDAVRNAIPTTVQNAETVCRTRLGRKDEGVQHAEVMGKTRYRD